MAHTLIYCRLRPFADTSISSVITELFRVEKDEIK